MKKILSAVLCAAMIITAMPMTFAASISEVFGVEGKAPVVNRTINADANMLVTVSGGTYAEGPVVVTERPISKTYDFKVELDMEKVEATFANWVQIARGYAATDDDYQTRLNNAQVKGSFTVEIVYPNALTVPDEFTADSKSLYGFSVSPIFKETKREKVVGTDTTTLTISLELCDPNVPENNYIKASDMESNASTYLADMSLACTGVLPKEYGTHVVTGKLTGNTTIWDDSAQIGNIEFKAVQAGTATAEVSETIKVSVPASGGTNIAGGNGGVSVPANKVTVNFVSEGNNHHSVTKANGVKLDVADIPVPERNGYVFAGWYADEYHKSPVTGEIDVKENTTLYSKWINVTVPSALANDRVAYVIGYPDGAVRPNDNITREEIATIFYRLLKKENRDELYKEGNDFTDVEADRWSNDEISTMANGGYIKGYADGTFKPENAITRGEFVTIAARFLEEKVSKSYKTFNDISNHWAEDAIHAVADQEWIDGYEDGSFKPDALITRAEAMAIINRMLVYHIDSESLVENVKHWQDNKESDWFYFDVLTATNTREHSIRENGYTEDWKAILPNPDWSTIK